MMNEPLCRSVDPAASRLVIMAPTGAGKTTLFDVRVPFGIANSIGSMLIAMQSDPDADDYCEKRLNYILDNCAPVLALKPTGKNARHLIKLNSRTYPECTLDVGGPGKSNRQRKSVQWAGLDEAWLMEYGAIREFEARLHDRWNGQLCVVSQGFAQEVADQKSELDEYWQTTDKAELQFECPECKTCQPYLWDSDAKQYSLKYDKVISADGSTDWVATSKTARLECANCGVEFADTYENRRKLAESLDRREEQYVATAIPERPGFCGRHFNVLAMYWVPWSRVVVEWGKALEALKEGDRTPMAIFVTKRLARSYWLPKLEASVTLTAAPYKLAEYWDGRQWEGELYRGMRVDVQMDHYWASIRAFRADGSSRLLYAGKVESESILLQIQERMKVPAHEVWLDANYFPGKVYDMCARNGWIALTGEPAQGYIVMVKGAKKALMKYFSNVEQIKSPSGAICRLIRFSRVKVTDETVRLRSGLGPAWEHGEDTPPDWPKHALSEVKTETKGDTGKPTYKYVRIKHRRNDLWWCEVAHTLGAIVKEVLRSAPVPIEDAPPEAEEPV